MSSDQKNLLLTVLVIIFVALGFFYYKNQSKIDLATELPNGDKSLAIELPSNLEAKLPSRQNENKALEPAPGNIVQFSIAINKARKAFVMKDYDKAIVFYNEALLYNKADAAYTGLFSTYSAQNNIDKARVAIETAIILNPLSTEHWIAKLTLLNEKTSVSFADLNRIYEEGLTKVDSNTQINLVTSFARIAESKGERNKTISLWGYAIEIYPQNKLIYQAEIDRLQNY